MSSIKGNSYLLQNPTLSALAIIVFGCIFGVLLQSGLSNTNFPDTAAIRTTTAASSSPSRAWHLMSQKQQAVALKHAGTFISKYGNIFFHGKGPVGGHHIHAPWHLSQNSRDLQKDWRACAGFGSDYGLHHLCGPAPPPNQPCTFISVGISNDYSFDVQVANEWNCRGFAADPTVTHMAEIHPKVTFHKIGANLLEHEGGGKNNWWSTSMPALKKFLKLDYIDVLKMDCEGCEYALAKDVVMEDPNFFHRIGQVSLETHVTKIWISSDETLYYYGLLFELMEEAGLQLAESSMAGCSPTDELAGCMPQFQEWNYSCGIVAYKPETNERIYSPSQQGSCHNFLFARQPSVTNQNKQ